MARFTYEGKTKDGTPVTQTVDVNDRYAVYDIARQNGHEVVSIHEAARFSFSFSFNLDHINAMLSRVKRDQLVMFTRNLSAMLKAGLPLTRALSVGERQTKNPRLKQIVFTLQGDIGKGEPLNVALGKHPKEFSSLYVSMVRAGEEGGTLADALSLIALQLHRSSELIKKVRGAMIYPAIVISLMGAIGVLMMIFVVPTLTATFKELDMDLPATTRFIMFLSDAFSQHTILVFGIMIGTIAGFVSAARMPLGRRAFEWLVVRLPVIGAMAKEMNAARTSRTLSSLLSSGVDVVAALSITADVVQNTFYKAIIRDAAVRVEKGKALSEAFIERNDLYPILVGEMIAVGEETGQISHMLEEVAEFYEAEVERKTKDLSTIIEPLLMVVIGVGVGFFALAMIMPIYSISDAL